MWKDTGFRTSFIVPINPSEGAVENIWTCMLAAALRRKGNRVRIFAIENENEQLELLQEQITEFNPNMIHLPMYEYNNIRTNFDSYRFVDRLILIAREIKKSRSGLHINCGGPYVSFIWGSIEKYYDVIDSIIIGEGEETICELVQRLEDKQPLTGCKGLYFTINGKLEKNKMRPLIKDLDSLPLMARDMLSTLPARIATSRGCLGGCTFCTVPDFSKLQDGPNWRGRSPKNIEEEIEKLHQECGVEVFEFNDASFEDPGEAGKLRLKRLCERIIDKDLDILMSIFCRAESFNEEDSELLRLMRRAGIYKVFVGIEAMSEELLDILGKKSSIECNARIPRLLKDADIEFKAGYIMISPYTSLQDVRYGLSFLHNHNQSCWYSIWTKLDILPNSRIMFRAKRDDLLLPAYGYNRTQEYKFKDPRINIMFKIVGYFYTNITRDIEGELRDLGDFIRYMELKHKSAGRIETLNILKKEWNSIKNQFSNENYKVYLKLLALVENSGEYDLDSRELKNIVDAYIDAFNPKEKSDTLKAAKRRFGNNPSTRGLNKSIFLRNKLPITLNPIIL